MRYGARLARYTKQWFDRFSYGGLLLGTIFFCFSMMPSLLPRPWLFQGIISGISLTIGYGIGTSLSSIIRWLTQYELPVNIRYYLWWTLAILAPVFSLVFVYQGHIWQNEVRQLVNEPFVPGGHSILMLLSAILLAIIIISLARAIRLLGRFLQRQLDRILPRRLSGALVGLILIVVFFWIVSGVFVNFLVSSARRSFSYKNNTTTVGTSRPASSLRSGSLDSLIPWQTLGQAGRDFVAKGPNTSQLQEFSGQPAIEPIRVYSGLESAKTTEARSQLAVKELERTGAFDRKILVIANTTGTGWLEPQAVNSLEYMWNGDSAIVAQQYSYLPSWMSFLVDKENATNTGRSLFDAVYGKWLTLPVNHRPELYTYGLSLGSFGGQAAYSGINGLRNAVSGALFVGTPNDTQLWQTVTIGRDQGSPQWQPVYKQDKTVRFAATNSQISNNQAGWQSPRVLYVQHGSDPVVWFNFNLWFHKPDWLKDHRAPDVSPAVHWYPIVTFWQIAIDQVYGGDMPAGYGHNYTNTSAASWAAITQPQGWGPNNTIRLQTLINHSPIE
ncbi:MAG: alpha/beta-hydrolase family protein [Candidatus Saccharimonadales bacterium]